MTATTQQPTDTLYRETPRHLYSCWQSLSIYPGEKARLEHLEETCARLLLYNQLFAKHGVQPKGMLYLGANVGQLLWVWILMGFRHVLMAEPQPEAFRKLEKWTEKSAAVLMSYEDFISAENRVQLHLAPCAIGDHDGDAAFYRTANSNLSSLLNPAMLEEESDNAFREHMEVKDVLQIPVRKMDSVFKHSNGALRFADFNTVYMNLQGAELLALKGMPQTLAHIDLIYLENNFVARYEGCPQAEELNQFLEPHGFRPVWGQFSKKIGNGFTAYIKA